MNTYFWEYIVLQKICNHDVIVYMLWSVVSQLWGSVQAWRPELTIHWYAVVVPPAVLSSFESFRNWDQFGENPFSWLRTFSMFLLPYYSFELQGNLYSDSHEPKVTQYCLTNIVLFCDRPPRYMGEGFNVLQTADCKITYYQDEPGLSTLTSSLMHFFQHTYMYVCKPSLSCLIY